MKKKGIIFIITLLTMLTIRAKLEINNRDAEIKQLHKAAKKQVVQVQQLNKAAKKQGDQLELCGQAVLFYNKHYIPSQEYSVLKFYKAAKQPITH